MEMLFAFLPRLGFLLLLIVCFFVFALCSKILSVSYMVFIVSLMCLFTFLWGWFLESVCCQRKIGDSSSLEIGHVLYSSGWVLETPSKSPQ